MKKKYKLLNWKFLLHKQKKNIKKILESIYENKIDSIYPKKKNIFRAFKLTKFHKIKVVILGQDPYFKKNQANGLAFSVNKGQIIPPSLKNIYQELKDDLCKKKIFLSGCLKKWAFQGVFLLNSILTVFKGRPLSHKIFCWENFTDYVIFLISKHLKNIVFLLWGKFAQSKSFLINNLKHYVLKASHPSPLSAYRSFLGCRHFSKTNLFLKKNKIKPIKWCNI